MRLQRSPMLLITARHAGLIWEMWVKEPTPTPSSVSTDVYGWSFVANRVRLSLFVLVYNLGNFLRRLCLPKAFKHWSLRSMQVKLTKMGGRLVRHSRRLIFQLSEVSVPRRLPQGVGLSSLRFHTIGGGPETMKTDKGHGSR